MRAMTSVGPPAGNPTTTRTGRLGYPSANDAATPDSNTAAARNMRKPCFMALSLGYVCWGHHRRARGTEQEQSDQPPSLLLRQRLDPVFQRDGAEIFSACSLAMQRASIESAAALISSGIPETRSVLFQCTLPVSIP